MKVSLIGIGPGDEGQITREALAALQEAGAVIGAARLLEALPVTVMGERVALLRPEEIMAWLEQHPNHGSAAVALSGDIGFYSGAARLRPLLLQAGHEVVNICGISTVEYLCAKAGIAWQDVHLVSAHGRDCDLLAHVLNDPRCFFLTGGDITPAHICRVLTKAGIGDCRVTVGEALSYPQEKLTQGVAHELAEQTFESLSAVLVERTCPTFCVESRSFGLPDSAFIRGKVPMTKSEVRSVILSRLAIRETDTVWDVGAGTGSVSVECALAARWGRVWAIEENPAAWELLQQNKQAFGVYNLNIIQGTAPDACRELPPPDAVFIGGSKGKLEEILKLAVAKNPQVRVVISAVTLETMYHGITCMEQLGFAEVEAVQMGISRAERRGKSHLLLAQNPVFVVSGVAHG